MRMPLRTEMKQRSGPSGWGPEALKRLASGAGMLGSWKVVLEGDFSGIPFTALWKHRWSSWASTYCSKPESDLHQYRLD